MVVETLDMVFQISPALREAVLPWILLGNVILMGFIVGGVAYPFIVRAARAGESELEASGLEKEPLEIRRLREAARDGNYARHTISLYDMIRDEAVRRLGFEPVQSMTEREVTRELIALDPTENFGHGLDQLLQLYERSRFGAVPPGGEEFESALVAARKTHGYLKLRKHS